MIGAIAKAAIGSVPTPGPLTFLLGDPTEFLGKLFSGSRDFYEHLRVFQESTRALNEMGLGLSPGREKLTEMRREDSGLLLRRGFAVQGRPGVPVRDHTDNFGSAAGRAASNLGPGLSAPSP